MTSKGTTRRSIRVPDEEWDPAIARAEADGTNLSEVIRAILRTYTPRQGLDGSQSKTLVPYQCTAEDICGAFWMGKVRAEDEGRPTIQCPSCGSEAVHPNRIPGGFNRVPNGDNR